MIPALRNCSTSPEPGCTITTTESATSATSVSDWPTPTVSITTTSNATASAVAAARVARASPPSRSPAAIERMKIAPSEGSCSIRARSPSSDPPLSRELGSTARTATDNSLARHPATSLESSVDLPTPGGPVTPTMWAAASAPSAAGEMSASSALASARAAGELLSTRFATAGAALRSPASRRPERALEAGHGVGAVTRRRPARRCHGSSR